MFDTGLWNACSGQGYSFILDCRYRSQRIMSATVVQHISLLNHRITFSSGAFSALVGNSNKISTISTFSHADCFLCPLMLYLALILNQFGSPLQRCFNCSNIKRETHAWWDSVFTLPCQSRDLHLNLILVGSRVLRSGQITHTRSFGLTADVVLSSQSLFLNEIGLGKPTKYSLYLKMLFHGRACVLYERVKYQRKITL